MSRLRRLSELNVERRTRYVLEQILSGDPTEIVVENIHEYLTTIGENVRSGKTKLEDFIVHKVSSNKMVRRLGRPNISLL